MAVQPFIRRVQLAVDGALSVMGDGSPDGLRITFNVTKTMLSPPNASEITVYNLTRGTRATIQRSLSRATLSVGYDNVGMSMLARGSVLNVTSQRSGADVATKIRFLDGYAGQVGGITSQTLGAGTQVKDAVGTLAKQLPGVTVGTIDVDGQLGSRGRSMSMPTKDALDSLATEYGFSWSIQDEVFQAVSDKRSLGGTFSIGDGNLINASPLLTSPLQITTGVEIQAILNPNVKCGSSVKLTSTLNPKLNGTYKVHSVSYNGDTHTNQWVMTIQSFLTNPGGY